LSELPEVSPGLLDDSGMSAMLPGRSERTATRPTRRERRACNAPALPWPLACPARRNGALASPDWRGVAHCCSDHASGTAGLTARRSILRLPVRQAVDDAAAVRRKYKVLVRAAVRLSV
jgi:hypothetical protein